MAKEVSYISNSLVRGLRILEKFDNRHATMTQSEIADAINVTSSAAYRFIVTLEQEGFLERTGSRYALGPRVMQLGYSYIKSLDINDIARPHADALRNATNFTVHVAILKGTEIIYVYRALSDRALVSNIPVGSRLPAFSTSMGRLLLSALPLEELDRRFDGYVMEQMTPMAPTSLDALKQLLVGDRARGYVAQRSHLARGTFTIAAPLVSGDGAYVGAINLSGHEQQLQGTPEMIARVRTTAQRISQML